VLLFSCLVDRYKLDGQFHLHSATLCISSILLCSYFNIHRLRHAGPLRIGWCYEGHDMHGMHGLEHMEKEKIKGNWLKVTFSGCTEHIRGFVIMHCIN